MKFGKTIATFLHGNQERFFAKCPRIEYKKLKKILRECRTARTSRRMKRKITEDEGTSSAQQIRSAGCPACDQMFFGELSKEVAEVVGCFSSRVKKLRRRHNAKGLHRQVIRLRRRLSDDDNLPLGREGILLLNYVAMNTIAVKKILKKYDKVHRSVVGRDFKARMQEERKDLLLSPWLIELGALYLNSFAWDASEPAAFVTQLACEFDVPDPTLQMVLSDSHVFQCSLSCPYCLVVGIFSAATAPVMSPECPFAVDPKRHLQRRNAQFAGRLKQYWERRDKEHRAVSSSQGGTWIDRVKHVLNL
ncbi:hypothetical protein HPP92_011798 [Vanilla planifolia]|uniref:RING-type E3 ubiquitin transferase n=1 Tax=Vanilla planifolia TaxID=51239 RepID=A0A835V1C8_VANPL|nr:hypothetical protein HPP92_011798 [Vanilla planifolia]